MEPSEQQIYLGVVLGGRYMVTAYLGSGNFSGVFQATDQHSGREVAVKVLSFKSIHSAEARVEFDGEKALLELLARCSHIVRLLDNGIHQLQMRVTPGEGTVTIDVPYLVLDLADASLSELLLNRARLPWYARLELFRDIVKGVHQMHLEQVVHRDIKSDNSLVYSAPQQARIADLGRSKDTRASSRFIAEAYVAGRGDLRFAPPELIWRCGNEEAAEMARVDLFLLGSLLFELATGVGITALVFADLRAIHNTAMQMAPAARKDEFDSRLGEMRQQFLPAYDLFEREVPAYLREQAKLLLKQLTDPDPAKRVPAFRRGALIPWDLQWLLRKVDILLRIDAFHTGRGSRITKSTQRGRQAKKKVRA